MCKELTLQHLKKTLFVIPDYQRGYRWTGKEVEKLLKDLATFPGNKYCLQPLELQSIEVDEAKKILGDKWKDGKFQHIYRLVDGQQRLTTISLIAQGLGIKPDWDIFYEFEDHVFFSELNDGTEKTINACFRNKVARAIATFISGGNRENVQQYFVPNSQKRIVFLEHMITDSEDPEGEKAFARLNAGKTPLTSSELIRALYMVNESGFTREDRLEISKEWELIENTLADNAFWMMFNTGGLDRTPTRIDLLFSLILNIDLNNTGANPRIIFEELETRVLNKTADLMKVWHEVMRCFWWMQSCYSDIEVYNFLGWIAMAASDKDACYIYKLFLEYPSIEAFREVLIGIIQKEKLPQIDAVHYGDPMLGNLLLLLNVLSCNKENSRFRFDLLESCDVEHIDSQTPNDLSNTDARYEWFLSVWKEYKDKDKDIEIQRIKDLISENYSGWTINDENDIKIFCEKNSFGVDFAKKIYVPEQQFDENGFGNLALLNSGINRSYHNDIFPQKRKRIRAELIEGTRYIPLCTARVFTKFYTEEASQITCWLDDDYNGYLKEMKELLDIFSSRPSIEEKEGKEPLLIGIEQKAPSSPPTPALSNQCNNQLPNPVCLSDFMGKYSVIIPEIQRLYVQGRQDSYGKKCLKGFAQNLVESAVTGSSQPLDMVYGIGTKNSFLPLDGQQRLTTLLLLSWLLNKVVRNKWEFRYRSRRATEIFVEYLLKEEPPPIAHVDVDEIEKRKKEKFGNRADEKYLPLVRKYLYSKKWFLTIWDSDPGIHGMLEMLDSLYDKLIFAKKIFKDRPIRDESCWDIDRVSFDINYLDLCDSFYDQIFLKMNSRGKELSPWENVKAILKSHVPDCICDEWHQKINFQWSETLWKAWDEHDRQIEKLDRRFLEIVSYALRFAGYNGAYGDAFEIDKWLREDKNMCREKFYRCAMILFSAIVDTNDDSVQKFLTPAWAPKPILPDITKEVQDFQKPLVVFFAAKAGNLSSEAWKRVVWNIVENSVNNVDSMISCLRLIDSLALRSNDILAFLASDEEIDADKSCRQQLHEERQKAKLLYGTHPGIELDGCIQEAERFMRGRIRIALLPNPEEIKFDTIACRLKALNKLAEQWDDAVGQKDVKSLHLIISMVMMAMPYWPIENEFNLSTQEDALRNLLHMNEKELAISLLDYLTREESPKRPEYILKANPFGWPHSDHKEVSWRRDWQSNLLWLIKTKESTVWEHTLKYHSSCFFYLFDKAKISSGKGAIPINDYRFDFICDADLQARLEDFYDLVGADNRRGMRMNNTCAHETMVNGKKWLFFYPDNVALDFINKDGIRSRRIIQFDNADDKSMFSQEKLKTNADKFFQKILLEIQQTEGENLNCRWLGIFPRCCP